MLKRAGIVKLVLLVRIVEPLVLITLVQQV